MIAAAGAVKQAWQPGMATCAGKEAREKTDRAVRKRVLILCTGNSCRSQMAEGFVNHVLGSRR
jgi:hypothetical protein